MKLAKIVGSLLVADCKAIGVKSTLCDASSMLCNDKFRLPLPVTRILMALKCSKSPDELLAIAIIYEPINPVLANGLGIFTIIDWPGLFLSYMVSLVFPGDMKYIPEPLSTRTVRDPNNTVPPN